MKTTLKICIAIVGVLLFVTTINLIIEREPLYGQIGKDNWVPDLTGEWSAEGYGYWFKDVTIYDDKPKYFEGPGDRNLFITHQTGRVFAGTWEGRKLTGVVLPDRTISIQMFELTELRIFLTGKLTGSRNNLEMQGYVYQFDDFGVDDPGGREMYTLYGRLWKIN